MKKWSFILCSILLFFVFACKKSGSPGNTTGSSGYLSSVTSYTPQMRIIDSFSYDSSHRIARFAQYVYDSTSSFPVFYGFTVDFTLPAGGAAPSAYTYNTIPAGASDPHQLTYDGQGRISKDTSLSGSRFVTYYTYPSNNIATNVLFDGTRLNNQIDTLYLSGSNVGSERVYFPNDAGTADSLEGSLQISYASTANPAYHTATAASIGPLLFILGFDGYGNFVDFISKNVYNKIAGSGDGLPPGFSLNYNLTTDSQGRLSLMTGSLGASSGSYAFRYY